MPSQELFEDLQDDDNMSHECGEVCIALFFGGVKIFLKKLCMLDVTYMVYNKNNIFVN